MLALLATAATVATPAAAGAAPLAVLRVCADPNNLPFSNQRGEGFENRLAELVARDLGAHLEYFWLPQHRGYVRNSLAAKKCDVMMEAPTGFERAATTRPYYRSTYVFVARRDRKLHLRSFDDPRLRGLRIGVQMVGADYSNTPPAHALGARGLGANVVGFMVYGDAGKPEPLAPILDAVVKGDVDTAVVWGPLAGWYARERHADLEITPVSPATDGPLRFTFSIGMGVRKDDAALRARLDRVIARRQHEIDAVLAHYGVPQLH